MGHCLTHELAVAFAKGMLRIFGSKEALLVSTITKAERVRNISVWLKGQAKIRRSMTDNSGC